MDLKAARPGRRRGVLEPFMQEPGLPGGVWRVNARWAGAKGLSPLRTPCPRAQLHWFSFWGAEGGDAAVAELLHPQPGGRALQAALGSWLGKSP